MSIQKSNFSCLLTRNWTLTKYTAFQLLSIMLLDDKPSVSQPYDYATEARMLLYLPSQEHLMANPGKPLPQWHISNVLEPVATLGHMCTHTHLSVETGACWPCNLLQKCPSLSVIITRGSDVIPLIDVYQVTNDMYFSQPFNFVITEPTTIPCRSYLPLSHSYY